MSDNLKKQSNPFSTGGGGVNFETRVQAAFSIIMFTNSCVPCLSPDMRAKSIKFQSKYDGANTDDFVINTEDQNNNAAILFAQIKHEITISEANDSIFSEVINGAWKDFCEPSFNHERDVIVLITGPLPKTDVHNTLPILEWAKYSATADEFLKKVRKKGFSSKTKLSKLTAFKSQLTFANEGNPIADDELWKFLKSFKIISYDLDSKNSTVASLLCSLIDNKSTHSSSLVLAKIITCVQEYNQNAGTLTFDNAPKDIKSLFDNVAVANLNVDIKILKERSDYIFSGIKNSVAGVHVERPGFMVEIYEKIYSADFVFVTGERGSGKSGVVKDFVFDKYESIPVFYIRAEDLDKSHLNDVFISFGMQSSIGEIETHFSLLPEKILVIESLEKVLELNLDNAFLDLLQFIRKQTGWTVIATGRDYAYQQLVFNYLQPRGISYESVNITGFTDEQIEYLEKEIPELNVLLKNESLEKLLHIPFFIELASRAIHNGAVFKDTDGEKDFRKVIWDVVISNQTERKGGMPAKRKSTFIEIAKNRAKQMLFGVPECDFDAEVVSKLEEDDLIFRDSEKSLISPVHDVLEDWALGEFINHKYSEHQTDNALFLSSIGDEPAINRAFRLWLFQKLKYGEDVNDFISSLLASENIEDYWKDETMAAILQSESPKGFLELLAPQLLEDDCAMLVRFCFVLRITCQRPNTRYTKQEDSSSSKLVDTLFLQPYGIGWDALINFIYEHRCDISQSINTHTIELLDEWCGLINIYDDLPSIAKTVGLIALWQLESIKESYRYEDLRKKLINILLKVSPSIEEEFDNLMEQDVFIPKRNPIRKHYVDELTTLATLGINVPLLCKRRPNFVIKLALHEWLLEDVEKEDNEYFGYSTPDVEESFGLDRTRDFFPASGAKGPFKYLLHWHPRLALDFIIRICNLTAEEYACSDFGSEQKAEIGLPLSEEVLVKSVELKLNDNSIVTQYSSPHLWKGYRGLSTLPYLLQCALMALENWLVDYIGSSESQDEIAWIYDHILRSSNSVMTSSVLASVATGFPSKVGESCFPLLRTPALYSLDLQRTVGEMGESTPHFFDVYFDRDPMTKIYAEDRKEAALRPWRKESLETLLTRLQLDKNFRDKTLEIVDQLASIASDTKEESLRFMLHRIDTREWEVIEDKENDRVLLQSTSDLPEDLKEVRKSYDKEHNNDNDIINLNLWAKQLFAEKIFNKKYFSSHKEALVSAIELAIKLQNDDLGQFSEMAIGAITTTAAISLRDNQEELNDEDVNWCRDIVCESVSIHADAIDSTAVHDVTDSDGSAACAYVLPVLFDYVENEEQKIQLQYVIAMALTHENYNVRDSAAKGVRDYIWMKDPDFAQSCLSGMVEYSKFMKREFAARRIHHLRGAELDKAYKKWIKLIVKFRKQLIKGKFNFDVDSIALDSHSSWFIHTPMLIIPLGTSKPKEVMLIKKLMSLVYEDESKNYRPDGDEKIDHNITRKIQKCFVEHLVELREDSFSLYQETLIEGCNQAPQLIYSIKLSFDVAMEKLDDFGSVWDLWSVLSPAVLDLALKSCGKGSSRTREHTITLIRGMLHADTPWQGHESEKKDIIEGKEYILDFASKASCNTHVFESLASLMHNFPDIFFSDGIHILADTYVSYGEDKTKECINANSAFYLERSIQYYLQVENAGPLPKKMYDSCITLLTGVVEKGSARAYYLREHLIRSRKIAV